MGNIGDVIIPSIPTVGSAGPQFATDINAVLTEIVTRLSTKVPLSSISFSSDLNLAGASLLNALGVTFSGLTGAPAGAPFSRFAVFNGDIYWVNAAGAVQITTGSTLNAAALAGITGDYGGANPAQFRYIAIDSRYNAYANFGTATWGFVRGLGFDVAGGATSSAKARILWGGVADINLTLPATLPTTTNVVMMDNTGAITAPNSVALAVNNNVTVSGTGTFKHGTKTICRVITGTSGAIGTNDILSNTSVPNTGLVLDTTGGGFVFGFVACPEIPTHSRIVNVTVTFDSAASRNACTGQTKKSGGGDPASRAMTSVGGAMSNAGTAKLTIAGLNVTPASGEKFYALITNTSAVLNPVVVNIIVDYDTP